VNGRLSIVFAAATMTAILVGVITTTSSSSFAQQGPIADDTEEHDRNQARLMDRTTYPNIISAGLQQSIMPSSPLNQSTSSISPNATLSVKTNEQFYITLSSSPSSTGYEWQVASVSNPDIVRFVDSQYIRPESELIGAPGKQVLTFNALQEGSATVMLGYVQPWETDVPPVRIYVAEVVVVENGIQQ
jgi:predicted secreted protein